MIYVPKYSCVFCNFEFNMCHVLWPLQAILKCLVTLCLLCHRALIPLHHVPYSTDIPRLLVLTDFSFSKAVCAWFFTNNTESLTEGLEGLPTSHHLSTAVPLQVGCNWNRFGDVWWHPLFGMCLGISIVLNTTRRAWVMDLLNMEFPTCHLPELELYMLLWKLCHFTSSCLACWQPQLITATYLQGPKLVISMKLQVTQFE